MSLVFLILAFLGLAGYTGFRAWKHKPGAGEVKKGIWVAGSVSATFIAVLLFVGLSVLFVGKNEIATLAGVYLSEDMKPGQIVALSGQNGPQARTMPPGFHFEPFIRFFYDIGYAETKTVPVNKYGVLVAKDGLPLRDGQVIADGWKSYSDMVDAEKFVLEGGQKGTQLTILPPGDYRINPYLFELRTGDALQVKTGEVAVIRSNVQTIENCDTKLVEEGLTTALVPKGCIGVWDEPLYQGMHYLNGYAYVSTKISTRAQVWAYKGGYTTKKINLTVNDDGSITQTTEPIVVARPENAADKAINVRVEGWTVPVEARVTVQVDPKNAPRVVAGVGTLQNVEDKITTPNIRDSLRTIGGREPSGCKTIKNVTTCKDNGAKVLDFVSKREEINKKVMSAIKPATEQAGVTILDVNLGEPAIPPELLVANQRKQIADQLNKTYKAEKETQALRIEVEKNRATAKQQSILVKAQIAEKAAVNYKNKRKLEGEGERLYLTEKGKGEQNYLTSKAKGEKARVAVLGEDRVYELEVIKIVAANPDMVKVPNTVVQGSGASLEGMAAVFGGQSNIAKSMAVVK